MWGVLLGGVFVEKSKYELANIKSGGGKERLTKKEGDFRRVRWGKPSLNGGSLRQKEGGGGTFFGKGMPRGGERKRSPWESQRKERNRPHGNKFNEVGP